MDMDQVLASFGLGELVADEFFVTQVGVLTVTGVLFVASLSLCIMAMRAAASAKRARDDVEMTAAGMQDIAGEMRQLTAQVERASYAQNQVDAEAADTDKTDVDEASLQNAGVEDVTPDADDDARKKPASALFRGLMRRR